MEQFFPFDSIKNAEGKGDRVYKSQHWADYYKNFITTGLMHNNGNTGLAIEGVENLQLKVGAGGAFIEGRQYILNETKNIQFTLEMNEFRRDLLVLRMDNRINERSIKLHVIQGQPNLSLANAKRPELIRNENIYDLGLYEVIIRPQITTIATSDITDLRGDAEYCTLSNPKGFGGATIFVGETLPNPQFVKVGDIWMPEIKEV